MVVGASGVGKTAIIRSLIQNIFPDYHEPTIEDTYRKVFVPVNGESCLIEILDTSGLFSYYSILLEGKIWKGDGFMCVYSVDDLQSYEEIDIFMKKIRLIKPGAPILLVSNKIDIRPENRK